MKGERHGSSGCSSVCKRQGNRPSTRNGFSQRTSSSASTCCGLVTENSDYLRHVLDTQQPFVIDNTNPTREERTKYIDAAKASQYSVVGFYFESKVEGCLQRNKKRPDPVPEVGILSTAKKLELPTMEEGFDTLNYVRLTEAGFVVEEWKNEV